MNLKLIFLVYPRDVSEIMYVFSCIMKQIISSKRVNMGAAGCERPARVYVNF